MATHQTEAEPQQPAAAAVEGVEAGQVAAVADQADFYQIERKYLQNLKIYLNVNEENVLKIFTREQGVAGHLDHAGDEVGEPHHHHQGLEAVAEVD